jgi:CRISPR-associated protein Cas1
MTTLYLTEPGTVVQYRNAALAVTLDGRSRHLRLAELDLIVVSPGVQLTSVVLSRLFDRGIETLFIQKNGQFRGRLQPSFATNPTLRLAQYQSVNTTFGLQLAKRLIRAKVQNQRALLQRRDRITGRQIPELAIAIETLHAYSQTLQHPETSFSRNELMGIEGICARSYFAGLRHWIPDEWGFGDRSRQPPADPVNALLSWGYGVLSARMFAIAVQAGFDPYLGFFHATEPYRPNLVLDLMEEFRPTIVDQAVIATLHSGLLTADDFEPSPDGMGVWLGKMGKKVFLAQLDRQFQKRVQYAPQNRRLAISQIMLEQARWAGRCLVEQTLNYGGFLIR